MTPKLTLRSTQRLKRNNDFIRVRKTGRSYRCPYFALFSAIRSENEPTLPSARIGISASIRVGNAVTRNRLKRSFRELFRLRQHQIRPEADIVISIRYPAQKASRSDLERRFEQAVRYNGLLRPSAPGQAEAPTTT